MSRLLGGQIPALGSREITGGPLRDADPATAAPAQPSARLPDPERRRAQDVRQRAPEGETQAFNARIGAYAEPGHDPRPLPVRECRTDPRHRPPASWRRTGTSSRLLCQVPQSVHPPIPARRRRARRRGGDATRPSGGTGGARRRSGRAPSRPRNPPDRRCSAACGRTPGSRGRRPLPPRRGRSGCGDG